MILKSFIDSDLKEVEERNPEVSEIVFYAICKVLHIPRSISVFEDKSFKSIVNSNEIELDGFQLPVIYNIPLIEKEKLASLVLLWCFLGVEKQHKLVTIEKFKSRYKWKTDYALFDFNSEYIYPNSHEILFLKKIKPKSLFEKKEIFLEVLKGNFIKEKVMRSLLFYQSYGTEVKNKNEIISELFDSNKIKKFENLIQKI